MQIQLGSGAFLDVSHESKSLFSEVWRHKGRLAVPDGAFPVRLKRVLLEVSFPVHEISRLKGVMLKVFVSQERTMKKIALPSIVIFNRSN